MANAPVLGVSALILDNARVLLVRRGASSEVYPGRWSLPGGKVNPGERLAAALRREVREETGLRVSVGDQVAVHEEPPYVIIVFRAEVTGGTLAPSDDADAAEWVALEEIGKRRTTPGLLNVLRGSG